NCQVLAYVPAVPDLHGPRSNLFAWNGRYRYEIGNILPAEMGRYGAGSKRRQTIPGPTGKRLYERNGHLGSEIDEVWKRHDGSSIPDWTRIVHRIAYLLFPLRLSPRELRRELNPRKLRPMAAGTVSWSPLLDAMSLRRAPTGRQHEACGVDRRSGPDHRGKARGRW